MPILKENEFSSVNLIDSAGLGGKMLNKINLYKTIIIGYSFFIIGIALIIISTVTGIPVSAKEILRILGTALLPASLISLTTEHYLRKTFIREMQEKIATAINSEFETIFNLKKIGISDAFSKMPESIVANLFSLASKKIKIIQTWIPDLIQLEKHFIDAIKNGAEIDFLILDPDSIHSNCRSIELGYFNKSDARESINGTLKEISRFFSENNSIDKVKVRIFDETPSIPMYFCDDVVITGWFWKKQMCIHGPHLKIQGEKTVLFREMNNYYEKVWENAKEYNLKENSKRMISTS